MQKSRKAATQGRIDCFFKSTGLSTSEPSSKKRKAEENNKFKSKASNAKRKMIKKPK